MKTAIVIFCKTPGLSPLKTRLGAEIGKRKAEDFYRLSLAVVRETVLRVIREYSEKVDAFWAVAEKEAITHSVWSSFPCIWTGEGGLGERINHIYEELLPLYDQVIIIGSDSPQITSDYIMNAIDKLSQHIQEGIIGPCRDGGFVLFGSKRRIRKSIWTEVIYSREDTLKQLTRRLDQLNYQYQMISELGDVDHYEDLIRLMNDYNQMGAKIQQQQKNLLYWLQDILISRTFYQEAKQVHVTDKN